MDNIKTWTGLPVEESVRMTEGRDKCRKYVDGVDVVTAKETDLLVKIYQCFTFVVF